MSDSRARDGVASEAADAVEPRPLVAALPDELPNSEPLPPEGSGRLAAAIAMMGRPSCVKCTSRLRDRAAEALASRPLELVCPVVASAADAPCLRGRGTSEAVDSAIPVELCDSLVDESEVPRPGAPAGRAKTRCASEAGSTARGAPGSDAPLRDGSIPATSERWD